MEKRGRVLVLLIVLGVLFSVLPISTIPADASPLTQVWLEMEQGSIEVDVSPGSKGIAEVAGTVTCKKWGPDSVKVYLTASSETGGASVVPPSLVFSGVSGSEETEGFSVTTRVPMGYSSSATPILTVSGSYDQGGIRTTIAPVSVIIIIKQYYEIEWKIDDRVLTVKSGEKVNIEFFVVNVGNGDDIFQIDFKNRDNLQSKGFKLPKPFEVHIAEDENKSIGLEIGAPEDNSGVYLTEISILSRGSLESDFPEEVIMTLHLKVTGSFTGQIGSIITSPLTIIIIILMIIVAVFLKLKHREKITSTIN